MLRLLSCCAAIVLVACEPEAGDTSDRDCDMVSRAVPQYRLAQQGYDALLPRAIAEDWQGDRFDREVAQWIADRYPAGGGTPTDVAASPSTNPCTCEISGVDELCAQYRRDHRPEVLCEAARAHERTHAAQCTANNALADSDPSKYECAPLSNTQRQKNEHAAYNALLAALRPWFDAHCTSRCAELALAEEFSGTIELSYSRDSHGPLGSGELDGQASYTSRLASFPVGVDGYSETWLGTPTGTGGFDYVVRDSETSAVVFTWSGHGSIVENPPVGRYTGEILRIDPLLCEYEFETSAVVSALDSDGNAEPSGLGLAIGDIAIDTAKMTMTGSRSLPLPQPQFAGIHGTNVDLPAQSFEHDASTITSGNLDVTWNFVPVP
ncbi:MAG: hypothetical protein IAG13_15760 [Deltaproteobacteria bacterium]|nr:hypothetical protein [Nannocystaceae bacterium]